MDEFVGMREICLGCGVFWRLFNCSGLGELIGQLYLADFVMVMCDQGLTGWMLISKGGLVGSRCWICVPNCGLSV
jgi:hypothetical protein